MTLGLEEFVRRFCLHVLPERFVKIRHYGLLGNRQRQKRLACARALLAPSPPPWAPVPRLKSNPAPSHRGRVVLSVINRRWFSCGRLHPRAPAGSLPYWT